MKIKVDGVTIELTKEQIEETKRERFENLKSLEDVLFQFGFKKVVPKENPNQTYYTNEEKGWHAEKVDYDGVWMVGGELQDDGSFPGGHVYWEKEELFEELIKH
ncbi:hypothetical protein [Sphingobacterium hungaricum]|uniref:Uncharacterized protein n=1 Tax=Sphingobacterium hungaricum TaxID=2082723 RepID=A0A928USQ6_9SPHI|nr:hypothetical protein [Sphingobacterium hungaricum]MBE8712510.1 hypothetical protein [Sphingobacterium hungaricum]